MIASEGEALVLGAHRGGGSVALCLEAAEWSGLAREVIGSATTALGALSRPPVALEGSSVVLDAAVAWPYLVTGSLGRVRVYDLVEGHFYQVAGLSSQYVRAAQASSGGASVALRLAARGPHAIVLALGRALLRLPLVRGSSLEGEASWLRQLAVRPWDATLVEYQ